MQATSDLYKTLVSLPEHEFIVKVEIGTQDLAGHINTDPYVIREDQIVSVTTGNQLFPDYESPIGNACSAEFEVVLLAPPQSIILRKRYCPVDIFVAAAGNVDGVYKESEWIPQGSFIVDSREYSGQGSSRILTLRGYDEIYSMEKLSYNMSGVPSSGLPIPDVVEEISNAYSLPLDSRNPDTVFESPVSIPYSYLEASSYRDILQQIAVELHGNWTITERGTLRFCEFGLGVNGLPKDTNFLVSSFGNPITFGDYKIRLSADRINESARSKFDRIFIGSRYESLKYNDELEPITAVRVTSADNLEDYYSLGDSYPKHLIEIESGVDGMSYGVPYGAAYNAWRSINGYPNSSSPPIESLFRYTPFECTGALLDPAAELGDCVSVGGLYMPFYTRSTNFSGLMLADISAPFDEEANHES